MRHRLAAIAFSQGRPADAERLLKQVLAMRQVELGTHHPDVAAALDDRIPLDQATGRTKELEPLLRRAAAIREWHQRTEPLAYGRAPRRPVRSVFSFARSVPLW